MKTLSQHIKEGLIDRISTENSLLRVSPKKEINTEEVDEEKKESAEETDSMKNKKPSE